MTASWGCQRATSPGTDRAGIVGGEASAADDAVVALVAPALACGDTDQAFCSGTLVGSRAVLTAAHCVDLAPPGMLQVFVGAQLGGGGDRVEVERAWVHPAHDTTDHDLALLALREPVTGVTPLAIDGATLDSNFVGETVRVVGFGADDAGATGTRRQGTSQVSELRPLTFVATPAPANSCEGDSGGPVLRSGTNGEMIAGVTVSGDPGCMLTSVNARLDTDRAWLDDTLARIAGASAPGPRAPLGASLCDDSCASDADCPAGTACTAAGRCGLGGMDPGRFAGACTSDADCGGGLCGADCTCYRPCGGSGCSAGRGGSWWLLCCLLALLVGCSRTQAEKAEKSPCPAGTSLHGAPPPDGRAQWCERLGAKQGPWIEWYPDGKVKTRGAFAAGQMTGHWIHYQTDGTIAEEGDYAGGRKTGVWKTFENGRRTRETTYSNDGAEAHFTAYRDDGSRWAEGVFVKQKENGQYREWHPNGQLAAEGMYQDGERVGSWHYWLPDGTPTEVEQGAFAGQD